MPVPWCLWRPRKKRTASTSTQLPTSRTWPESSGFPTRSASLPRPAHQTRPRISTSGGETPQERGRTLAYVAVAWHLNPEEAQYHAWQRDLKGDCLQCGRHCQCRRKQHASNAEKRASQRKARHRLCPVLIHFRNASRFRQKTRNMRYTATMIRHGEQNRTVSDRKSRTRTIQPATPRMPLESAPLCREATRTWAPTPERWRQTIVYRCCPSGGVQGRTAGFVSVDPAFPSRFGWKYFKSGSLFELSTLHHSCGETNRSTFAFLPNRVTNLLASQCWGVPTM
jgi:hypothetical protein